MTHDDTLIPLPEPNIGVEKIRNMLVVIGLPT
jgi:hypothetical protein